MGWSKRISSSHPNHSAAEAEHGPECESGDQRPEPGADEAAVKLALTRGLGQVRQYGRV